MREIKFRSWIKEKNYFIYKFSMPSPVNSESDKNVLMQYTGLHDKNGKEVYEGDILKHKKELFVVEWSEGIASFKCVAVQDINHYPAFNIGTIKGLEIVGNIYENPDLVEVL